MIESTSPIHRHALVGLPWADVRFDHGAALLAAERCERMAALLDETADVRARAAGAARREWRGPTADEFEVGMAALLAETAGTVSALRILAARIRDASAEAKVEQRRREARRAERRRAPTPTPIPAPPT